jgi:hypothetical protein
MNYTITTQLKAKTWFYSKPKAAETTDFSRLFKHSINLYGQILLVIAILLSGASLGYLKLLEIESKQHLQATLYVTERLAKQKQQLEAELDSLSASGSLAEAAYKIGMIKPDLQKVIYLHEPK